MVAGEPGEYKTDSPSPQPLEYFTRQRLSPGEPNVPSRAEVRVIGTVRGYPIYDVTYYCFFDEVKDEHQAGNSIIVKTGQNEYREIFFAEIVGPGGGANLIKMSDEQHLVWERMDYGGKDHTIGDWGLWLGPDGPVAADIGIVWKAVEKVKRASLPADAGVMTSNATITVKDRRFVFEVAIRDFSRSFLVSNGTVQIDFIIKKGIIVVGGSSYRALTQP
jgi:hypothetical protein